MQEETPGDLVTTLDGLAFWGNSAWLKISEIGSSGWTSFLATRH